MVMKRVHVRMHVGMHVGMMHVRIGKERMVMVMVATTASTMVLLPFVASLLAASSSSRFFLLPTSMARHNPLHFEIVHHLMELSHIGSSSIRESASAASAAASTV